MLKSIIGLIHPDEGEVLYDGRNIVRMGKTELNLLRRETGVLFQGSALFDSMTVLENVMFPLDMFSKETTPRRSRLSPSRGGPARHGARRPASGRRAWSG